MPRILVFRLALVLVLTGFTSAGSAEQLVGLRTGEMPALPGETRGGVVTDSGDRLLLFTPGGVWELQRGGSGWKHLVSPPGPRVLDAVARTAYVFLGDADGSVASELATVSVGAGEATFATVLPMRSPLRDVKATMWRDRIYVAGNNPDGEIVVHMVSLGTVVPVWTELPVLPEGGGRVRALVAQDAAVFAFLERAAGAPTELWRWRDEGGWAQCAPLADGIVPGTARAIGQAHISLLGTGAGGGSPLPVHVYHTITNVWATMGEAQIGSGAYGTAWGDGALMVQPDATNGGAKVTTVEIEMTKRLLRAVDWIVIVVYLGGMACIGLYCYIREKRASTADYFVGGRSIPFWAAGLSLYATGTSAISYIAIPAKSFATNWLYLAQNVVGLFATIFVAIWIVPLIRRLDIMSVYHYLEMRFHPAIRMLASGICIILQLGGRMSVVLFLPSLAISAVTGLGVIWSICIMGFITIIYTVMGGMKAVIWTDVIQVIVMLGGAFFAIGYVVYKLEGGVDEFLSTSIADDKMRLFDFRWDLTKATVWGFVFLAVLEVLTYPKDQVMMQRVLSTKSAKAAGWSVWTLAAVVVPGSLTFYAIGTALYAFYKHHPEKMNPLLTVDATFPHFIAAELPVGVTGLIIAGIFAASMSTLSSCINSVATLVSVDFYEKIAKNPDPKLSVRIAEALTVVAGVLGVGTAILLSFFDIRSFFDLSLELAGLLGGGFAGTYALGIFTRRANWQGAAIGVCVSIGVTLVAWSMRLVHSFFYSAIAILTCIVVGYAASLFFPPPQQSLAGLTICDRSRRTTRSTPQ